MKVGVSDKTFDGDFQTKMQAVKYKDTPMESLTINDILKVREIEKFRETFKKTNNGGDTCG